MCEAYKKWEMLGRRLVYDEYVHIYEEEVKLPDGSRTRYVVNRSRGGAGVLVALDEERVLLSYQYRYPIDRFVYDLPGGKIEEGESPVEAARRECIEETGYEPLRMKKLVCYYPSPGRSDGALHIFFSDGGEKVDEVESGTPTEKVEGRVVGKYRLGKMIASNDIVDPSLLLAWYTAKDKGLV